MLVIAGSLTVIAAEDFLASAAFVKLRLALMGLATAHPVLLTMAAAAAVGVGIYAALNREAENFLETMLEMAQKSVGLAKAEEQRAKRLETLIALYRSNAEALDKASDPAQVKKFTDSMGDLVKEIESAAKAGDKAFEFDLSDAEGSLKRATALVDNLRQSYEDLAVQARTGIRENISDIRRQVDALEAYKKAMQEGASWSDAWAEAVQAFGGDSKEAFEALKDTALFVDRWWSTMKAPGTLQDADQAFKTLNATLGELEDQLSKLDKARAFIDAIQDAIDMKRLLHEIRMEMDANTESARHLAAMAAFSGATQVDALTTAGDAIRKNIALVQGHVGVLKSQGEETEKLDKLLDGLNQQLAVNNNRIVEGGQAFRKLGLAEYLKRRTDEVKLVSAAAIQRAKDNKNLIESAQLEVKALEETKAVYQAAIVEANRYGLETRELEIAVNGLNKQIEIQTDRLNDVIIPMENAAIRTRNAESATEAFTKGLDKNRAVFERNAQLWQAMGVKEVDIAKKRVEQAKEDLKMLKGRATSLNQILELVNALADAYLNLKIARLGDDLREFKTTMQNTNAETDRQIALAKSWGATSVQTAQMRIDALKGEQRLTKEAGLTSAQTKKMLLALDEELKDATSELAIAEATAARESAEAWIKAYEKRKDAWAKLIGKGLSRKGIMETIERIQQEMVDRWVRTAFEPIIDRLTKWEFQMLGISPEQISEQEKNRQKMIQALSTGGMAIEKSIIMGANYHAGAIRAAMQGQPFSFPGATVGTSGFSPSDVDKPLSELLKLNQGGGGLDLAGQYGLAILPTLAANMKDWTTGRGGGVRAAGYGIGATIGGIVGGPQGAAFGGQAGQGLVTALQELKHAIWDDTEERKRPQAETLREQVGSVINRGTFGNAAQITYHIENNVNMGFMIPDREAGRRAVAWIRENLSEYGANVTVQ